jgi:hypothetical protein
MATEKLPLVRVFSTDNPAAGYPHGARREVYGDLVRFTARNVVKIMSADAVASQTPSEVNVRTVAADSHSS